MEGFEFKVPVKTVGALEGNFDELRQQIKDITGKYANLVYTDDQIKEAKADRAFLNKQAKIISDRYKEIKDEYEKPLVEFKKEVDSVVKIINEASSNVDAQVKAAEAAEKDRKRQAIREYWDGMQPVAHVMTIPLDKVWNDRWLNKTYTDQQWQGDMKDIANRVKADLSVITSLSEDMREFVSAKYVATLNLSSAIAEWDRMLEEKKKAEDFKRQVEAKAAEKEEKERRLSELAKLGALRDDSTNMENQSPVNEVPQINAQNQATERIYAMEVEFEGYESLIKELSAYIRSLATKGLKYKVGPHGWR